MRTAICTFLVVSFFLGFDGLAKGQSPQRGAGRGGRFATAPGEVITPPDRSERWRDELRVGEAAPDFTLPLASSSEEAVGLRGKGGPRRNSNEAKSESAEKTVTLSELRAEKPVVLIFGSVTCPPFRSQLEGIDEVHRDFKDRAEFLFVYIREAHPDSVLSLVDENLKRSLVKVPQHETLTGRTEAAASCGRTLELTMPIAVDSIDNKVGRAYAGWPNRMVVVGTNGRISMASDPSPRGTDARKLRAWLEENLGGGEK